MKILHIVSYDLFPIQSGGSRVTLNYLNNLINEGNKIDLVITKKSINVKNLFKGNVKVYDLFDDNPIKKFSIRSVIRLLNLVNTTKPNLVIIECPWFGLVGIISKLFLKIQFYIRSHNVEYLRMKRLDRRFWFILKIYEKIVYKYAEKIICISELDKKTLETELNISPKKIEVSEYIPDPKIFKKNIRARKMIRKLLNIEDKFVVLFFGSLDYQPNIEAVEIIRNKITPRVLKQNKYIKFLIVGRNPNNLKSPSNIIFNGYVEKIEDYINASDLVIVPLISGGGIRTKILEALACKKRIISTSLGAQGINTNKYKSLLSIEDDWIKFSKLIVNYFKK